MATRSAGGTRKAGDASHIKNTETELTRLNEQLYKQYMAEQNEVAAQPSKKTTKKSEMPPEVQQFIDATGGEWEATLDGPRGKLFAIKVPHLARAKNVLRKLKQARGREGKSAGILGQVGVSEKTSKMIIGTGVPNFSWNADETYVGTLSGKKK